MAPLASDARVNLCNRAFEAIEHRGFTAFDDGSEEATRAALHYDEARIQVLEAFDWNFARKYNTPDAVANVETHPDRPYAFALPSVDLVRVRHIVDPPGVDWERAGDHLMADCAGPLTISYTASEENAARFPAVFGAALVHLLAHYFAPHYTRSQNRAEIMFRRFQAVIDQAALLEAREGPDQGAYGHDAGDDIARGLGASAGGGWGY